MNRVLLITIFTGAMLLSSCSVGKSTAVGYQSTSSKRENAYKNTYDEAKEKSAKRNGILGNVLE